MPKYLKDNSLNIKIKVISELLLNMRDEQNAFMFH